jgi:hypothetical protein
MGPTRVLVIRNADTSFVYFSASRTASSRRCRLKTSYGKAGGLLAAPSSRAPKQVDLTGQGVYDPVLGTTHLGILQSPQTKAEMLKFLTTKKDD